MIGESHRLTAGYIARHVPPAATVDRGIAILDIAQDFLLTHLEQRGLFGDLVVFKGGTALRKLFAGSQGRFSTDIDLGTRKAGDDRAVAADLIAAEAAVVLGPFHFAPHQQRGRWEITVTSDFGNPTPTIKLDVGPPCWLEAETRAFVPHPTHPRYGFQLPRLPTMRLEEILAEKVARLARRGTARDAFDLVWAATTAPHSQFDRARVRRLAVLKTWVDNRGMEPGWPPTIAAEPLKPDAWLSPRGDWDDEQIGMLTHPPPSLERLETDLRRLYGWLRDLSPDEGRWAAASPRDRAEVIREIQAMELSALGAVTLR